MKAEHVFWFYMFFCYIDRVLTLKFFFVCVLCVVFWWYRFCWFERECIYNQASMYCFRWIYIKIYACQHVFVEYWWVFESCWCLICIASMWWSWIWDQAGIDGTVLKEDATMKWKDIVHIKYDRINWCCLHVCWCCVWVVGVACFLSSQPRVLPPDRSRRLQTWLVRRWGCTFYNFLQNKNCNCWLERTRSKCPDYTALNSSSLFCGLNVFFNSKSTD